MSLAPVPAARAGCVVMVVFREPELRRAMTDVLRGEGYEVVTAASSEGALALLRERDELPAAVIFELEPDGGRDLRDALLSTPAWASVPQLAFASRTDHGPRRAMVEVPISITEVLVQLRRITGEED